MMLAGRPADHPLGLRADRQDPLRLGVDGHDGRLAHDDPAVADVDQRVGCPEVDPDVAGEEAEDPVEHVRGGSFVTGRCCRVALGGRFEGRFEVLAAGTAGVERVARNTGRVGRAARAVYPVAPAAAERQSVARALPSGRSNATPRSRSETYASWPMTRWSSSWMSSRRPAASASAVR